MKPNTTIPYARTLGDQLQTFLLQYDISIESGIVEYAMQELTDVRFDSSRSGLGFDFGRYYQDSKQSVNYRIPDISLKQYHLLAKFFELPEDKQIISNTIEVSQKVMEAKVFPKLKKFINDLKVSNPDLFMTFIIASKAKLEAMAYEQTKDAATQLKEFLVNPENPVLNRAVITQAVLAVSAANSNIKEYPEMYDLVFANAKNSFLNAYQNFVLSNKNEELTKACQFLLEGVNRFEKYNRCRSINAGKNLMSALKKLAEELNLSIENSDFFEHTLLKLAGIEKIEASGYRFGIGDDKSRLVFTIPGLNKNQQQKLIKFLKDNGDNTAKEGKGYQEWIYYRPSGIAEQEMAVDDVLESSYSMPESNQLSFFECDALSFYTTVFPVICSTLRRTSEQNPQALSGYRPNSMFHNRQQQTPNDEPYNPSLDFYNI